MNLATMSTWLSGLPETLLRQAARKLLMPLWDRSSSLALFISPLVIKSGGSTLTKTGAASSYLLANGVMLKVAAATDMPALAGTVTNATFNCFAFFIDSAGVVTSQMGTAGATLAAMLLPQLPVQKALIGFVIINPTGTGDFVGGTTALDDATVVPNAAYVSASSGFDPYATLGAL